MCQETGHRGIRRKRTLGTTTVCAIGSIATSQIESPLRLPTPLVPSMLGIKEPPPPGLEYTEPGTFQCESAKKESEREAEDWTCRWWRVAGLCL